MKKRNKKFLLNVFIFLLILNCSYLNFAKEKNNQISNEVIEKIQENGSAKVIINLKEENKRFNLMSSNKEDKIKKIKENKEIIEFSSGGFELEINESELIELAKNQNVLSIEPVREFHLHLQESIEIINASLIWNVQDYQTLNLTGAGNTICVIDTGINFSHQDVAGIAAANGSVKGVAKDAKLIGLKVFPGSSRSGATTTMIKNAIDWCVDNSETYNITVISLSLGTDTQYSTNCDSLFPSFNTSINNAFNKNISVVVSSGNEGSTTGISSPACISKAIPVGDTYDANLGSITWTGTCTDSTTAIDKIVCHANRNSLVKLFAPGALINSTYYDGDYLNQGGTSMAAPHVSGAIAVLNQFLNLSNLTKNPWEIEDILNETGKQIKDSFGTGLNFSRIDVYSAIKSLDTLNPIVSLLSPEDNSIQFIENISFSCSANDVQLTNLTLYIWNSTGIYNNTEYINASGTNAKLEVNLSNIPYGDYEWNCLAYDENRNFSFASSNSTFTIKGIETILNSPENNSFVNSNQTYNCSSETKSGTLLSNITFYVWNSTKDLVHNSTEYISGATNSSLFYFNFTTEQEYYWNCLSYNNESESNLADSNFTINYDITEPLIENISESISTTSAIIGFDSNELINSTINYGTSSDSLSASETDNNFRLNHLFSLSGLSSSTTYYYNITNCDRANNCIINGTNSFTTSAEIISNGNEFGGGGGGGTIITAMTYIPSNYEIILGYRKSLTQNDKIKFTIFDGENGVHTLTLDYVGTNSVNITIRSEPIIVSLGIGQSIKLNLSSAEYYDLYIKLNSISNNKADITIQGIKEIISKPAEITGESIEEVEKIEEQPRIIKKDLKKETLIYGILLILVIIGVIILFRRKSNKIKREKTKKEYREKFKKEIKPKKKKI